MTPRSIRRAAERKALKLARKAEKAMPHPAVPAQDAIEQVRLSDEPAFLSQAKIQLDEPAFLSEAKLPEKAPAISPAQLAANRANAQLSTGPTSTTGKAKSSLNAVKTGLTGHTVLLPGDDAAMYEAHVAEFIKRFEPAGDEERNLVQSLADTDWRLLRIPGLEMGIYALGHLEFADQFAKEDEAVRKHLIEAQIFLTHRRDLNNLSLQESRLRRQREKDREALKELQDARKLQAKARLDKACRQYIVAVNEKVNDSFDLGQFGFEFSLAQIEGRALELKPDLFEPYHRASQQERRTKAA